MMFLVSIQACSLGLVCIVSSERGIRSVSVGDDEDVLLEEACRACPGEVMGFAPTLPGGIDELVIDALESGRPHSVALDLVGTDFQKKVWDALRKIPHGEVVTYSELARMAGSPGAHRSAGSACGKNPAAVLIPCHRAVSSSGSGGAFRWGARMKETLLERETAGAFVGESP